MSGIFISYRRDDSSGYAGRLFHDLARHFGPDRVFMDIDTLQPGVDFVDALNEAVSNADVVLILIGPHWWNLTDAEGNRRIENPDDFVRMEVAAALSGSTRVIPVLVGNASMPPSAMLPDDIRPLGRRHAYEISDRRWDFDVKQLIDVLSPVFGSHVSRRPITSRQEISEPAEKKPAPPPQAAEAKSPSGLYALISRPGMGCLVAVVATVVVLIGAQDYVRKLISVDDPNDPTAAPTRPAALGPTQTSAPTSGGAIVTDGDPSQMWGTPQIGQNPREQLNIGDTVVVTANRLTVRSEPTTNSAPLTVVNLGETFTIRGGPVNAQGYVWWRLALHDGSSGWVVQKYIRLAASDPP